VGVAALIELQPVDFKGPFLSVTVRGAGNDVKLHTETRWFKEAELQCCFLHCDLCPAQRSARIGGPRRKAASERQFFLALIQSRKVNFVLFTSVFPQRQCFGKEGTQKAVGFYW